MRFIERIDVAVIPIIHYLTGATNERSGECHAG